MKTYKEFLTEIGNSRRPYKFKWYASNHNSFEGTFTADSGIKYDVAFWIEQMNRKPGFLITFVTNTHSEFVTNAGISEAFRVVATIIAMTKDAIDKAYLELDIDIKVIRWENSKWGDMKTQNRDDHKAARARKKLYTAFAKKELGAKRVKEMSAGDRSYVELDLS